MIHYLVLSVIFEIMFSPQMVYLNLHKLYNVIILLVCVFTKIHHKFSIFRLDNSTFTKQVKRLICCLLFLLTNEV